MVEADETRAKVLAEASRILREEGADGLSNRRIAKAAGVTTMAIYSRFGSKGGILDALYEEGVETLLAAQAEVAAPDPVNEVLQLTLVFRRIALEFRGHYHVLFGHLPGWKPSPALRARLFETFERLEAPLARGVEAERFAGPPRELAASLFSACHGHVSLEIAGYTGLGADQMQSYLQMVRRVLGLGAK